MSQLMYFEGGEEHEEENKSKLIIKLNIAKAIFMGFTAIIYICEFAYTSTRLASNYI